MCPSCGTSAGTGLGAPVPKSKTTAVVLAVIFGFWTWCYTYKRDSAKFWIAFGVTFGVGLVTLGIGALILGPAFWIWAIIDASMKPESYYTNFPND